MHRRSGIILDEPDDDVGVDIHTDFSDVGLVIPKEFPFCWALGLHTFSAGIDTVQEPSLGTGISSFCSSPNGLAPLFLGLRSVRINAVEATEWDSGPWYLEGYK